jgi:hypothetical protein
LANGFSLVWRAVTPLLRAGFCFNLAYYSISDRKVRGGAHPKASTKAEEACLEKCSRRYACF